MHEGDQSENVKCVLRNHGPDDLWRVRQWISKCTKEADQQASESLLLALFTFCEKWIQSENWVLYAENERRNYRSDNMNYL